MANRWTSGDGRDPFWRGGARWPRLFPPKKKDKKTETPAASPAGKPAPDSGWQFGGERSHAQDRRQGAGPHG